MADAEISRSVTAAVEFGNVQRVIAMLRRDWAYLARAEPELLSKALAIVPAEVMGRDPVLVLAAEVFEPLTPRLVERGDRQIKQILDGLEDLEDDHLRASAGLCALIALRRRGAFGTIKTIGPRLDELADAVHVPHHRDGYLSAVLQFQLGLAYLLADDMALAERYLAAAHRKRAPIPNLTSDAASKLAFLHALQGDSHLAQLWIERSLGTELDPRPRLLSAAEHTCRVAAQLLLALDRLDWTDFHRSNRTIERLVPDECWTFILYARARAALMLEDQAAAISMIHRHRAEFPTHTPTGGLVKALLDTAEADLWMSLRRPERAAELVDRFGDSPLELATAARLRLLQRQTRAAVQTVDDANWPMHVSRRDRANLLLLAASAQLRLNGSEGDRPLRRLAATLADEIEPWLFTMALADRDLIPKMAQDAPELGGLAETLIELDPARPFAAQPDRVNLTKRELAVLEGLARGRSVAEIAEDFSVSPSTIKNQRKSIFRKLGASSRDHAVETAHRAGLLPPSRSPDRIT